jgi:hypothetical protein
MITQPGDFKRDSHSRGLRPRADADHRLTYWGRRRGHRDGDHVRGGFHLRDQQVHSRRRSDVEADTEGLGVIHSQSRIPAKDARCGLCRLDAAPLKPRRALLGITSPARCGL